MTNERGFIVKNDRFSLKDKNEYRLSGWLREGTKCSVFIGAGEIPSELAILDKGSDERYGGVPARLIIHLDEKMLQGGYLRVYAENEGRRALVFRISSGELRKKRRAIQYFIDDASVLRDEGLMRIQGWAVSRGPVDIEALVAGETAPSILVERYKRYDTEELFDECEIDLASGFNIEIRPIPQKKAEVIFRTSDDEIRLDFPTAKASGAVSKVMTYAGKARNTLLYGGIPALAEKTWNKLFNPAAKRIEYGRWIARHLPSERELARQAEESFSFMPLISIVVPCYRTPEKYLRELVASVQGQSYKKWELILSDGSGQDSPIAGILAELSASDARIKVVSSPERLRIAENTNAALDAASGEWVGFADHDDLLVRSALYELVKLINEKPEAEMVYTDEDKIGPGDKLIQPNLKPDFSPDFLRSVNYICHMLFVKRELLERTGSFDPAFEGAQDHDFILRCTEKTDRIFHIPKVLYHWRFFDGSTSANPESKQYAFEAGVRAVQAHYDRLSYPASAEAGEYPGLVRTRWHWEEEPLVTVLIPNKDHLDDLEKCIKSLIATTTWSNFEIVIIENNSTSDATFEGYKALEAMDARIRTIFFKGPFNYSAINNFGVEHSGGEYLLFLNNDTESISDFITEMMGYAMRPDVGGVGARLYYGDDTIQHAGAIVGWGGVAGHAFVNQPRGSGGYQHRIICQQDYSAVTAACFLMRRSVFEEVGGFRTEFAVAFNDIDLCMKIRERGYLIVYDPFAELYHYESKSRGLENTPEKQSRFSSEIKLFKELWPEVLKEGDPYYNPNLSMVTQDFSLKKN